MQQIWIERRKWPDTPHYGHAGWVLGEDDHGLWLELRVGTPVYRGEDVAFHLTSGGLMLVPQTDDYLAWFLEYGELELYVDVVSGTVRTATSVITVDLDLDVIRRRDGTVDLLDVDEFEAHQVELDYPDDLVDHAEGASQQILAAVSDDREPFSGAAARLWMTRRQL